MLIVLRSHKEAESESDIVQGGSLEPQPNHCKITVYSNATVNKEMSDNEDECLLCMLCFGHTPPLAVINCSH